MRGLLVLLALIAFIGGLVGWLVVDARHPAGTYGNRRGHLRCTAAIVGGPVLFALSALA